MRCELIDYMGSDLSVVRAAKVSFANDQDARWQLREGYSDDEVIVGDHRRPPYKYLSESHEKLIRYLAAHSHWTPFAHTAITFRCSAPVPIRTQCFKHKVGFTENEESRRYIKSTPELYTPYPFRKAPTGSAKQGSDGAHADSLYWELRYKAVCMKAIGVYEQMVKDGVCPEQARFILPQGCMVNWYWTGSLPAYARFYKQRTDPHAQAEVRVLAELIGGKLGELFPVSWKELIG